MSGDVAAPTSTAEIASTVIEQAEAAEGQPIESTPDPGESTPTPTDPTPPPPIAAKAEPPADKPLSEEEQLLAEFGF